MDIKKELEARKANVQQNAQVVDDIIWILSVAHQLSSPLADDKCNYENLLKREGMKRILQEITFLKIKPGGKNG